MSSFLLPSFSEVVEMSLNAKLLVRSFLAAVVLCVTGGFDFRLSAQELGERLRPDQMVDPLQRFYFILRTTCTNVGVFISGCGVVRE